MIGKIDAETGKMKPDNNCYELFKAAQGMRDAAVRYYGYPYLALKCRNDCGLAFCLNDTFKERVMDIITAAGYIVREGGVTYAVKPAHVCRFDGVFLEGRL